jgi:hypothetical protein
MEQRQGLISADAATGVPFAMFQAYLGFYEQRSRALAEYWRALGAARRPEDLMGVQMDYWTTMLRDYASMAAEGAAALPAAPTLVGATGQRRVA